MKLTLAAVQMRSRFLDVRGNLDHADALLRRAHAGGAELAVLPEMFNTGYGYGPDYAVAAEDPDGPTIRFLRDRSRRWGICLAAGFVERDGHHLYDALAWTTPDGTTAIYRKRNLVFWERSQFRPGRSPLVVPTPWGRVGFAICADMIYRRVWADYRNRIDLAVVAAAWPRFACRHSGRKHWLLGHVGPLAAAIPGKVAVDLGIPVVFANQCGETETTVPIIKSVIADCFAGRSSITDGHHAPTHLLGADEDVLISSVTLHPPRGPKSWHSMSPSVPAACSSTSAP